MIFIFGIELSCLFLFDYYAVKLDYWKLECMLFVKIMLVLKHSEFKTDYDQVIEVLVNTVHL
jgi:hypothetical protein